MKVEALKTERIEDFKEYCRKHRSEIDDSYLHDDEDLEGFEPNDENPTYIITNEQGELTAAASLIIDEYHRKGKRGRFRILHSEVEDIECYSMLLQAVVKHTEDLDNIIVFVPMVNEKLMKYVEGLKFSAERYSFLLLREAPEIPDFNLPQGYEIRPFRSGYDEEAWCEVRNASFAKLKGNDTLITPEILAKQFSGVDHIEGGEMMLYHGERPVGAVRGTNDEYEDLPVMVIGPLAIIPEYQGKGLGRSLLRASLRFAKEKSYKRTLLCVNAENERAKALYIQEGFKQVEAVTCYKYDLR